MRKKQAKKRIITPDPTYKDTLVARFVNNLMLEGKKNAAYTIFYGALDAVGAKTEEEGIAVWRRALDNIMPSVEVKRRRVGGATFQVPIEVRPERKVSLAIKWMIRCARLRSERSMQDKLVAEILAAARGEGGAMKKRNDLQKVAESNRAFSFYRF